MKRHVLLLGIVGGILITLLQWAKYRFLVVEHSVEIYAGFTAATFAVFGIWLGMRLTAKPETMRKVAAPDSVIETKPPETMQPEGKREELGITRRELEILGLIAEGLSNREIAEKLFVSENTVKTHCSRAFEKLGAKRRTQAVQLAKEIGLLA